MYYLMNSIKQLQLLPKSYQNSSQSFLKYLQRHTFRVLFALFFLIGMVLGVILLQSADGTLKNLLHVLLNEYIENRKNQSFSSVAFYTFMTSAFFFLILFFCGFCSISQPVIFLLLLFRGIGYGFSLGGLYAEKGSGAIQYIFTFLYIPLLLGALLLICAAYSSLALSVRLWRSATGPSEQDERYRMRNYCVKYLLYLIFLLFIALLDGFLSTQFQSIITL